MERCPEFRVSYGEGFLCHLCIFCCQASPKNTIGPNTVPGKKQGSDSGLYVDASRPSDAQHNPPAKVDSTTSPSTGPQPELVPKFEPNGQMKPKSPPLQQSTSSTLHANTSQQVPSVKVEAKGQHSHPAPASKPNGQVKPTAPPVRLITSTEGGYQDDTTTIPVVGTGSEYQQHLADMRVLYESGDSFAESMEVG